MKTECIFRKFDVAKQIVYGTVYAPLTADSQGDWATAETIEKMAHDFSATNRANAIDIEHNLKPSGAVVVESFVVRKGDKDFAEGAWAMGIKTPDNIWQLVKAGKITGLSMYGRGERVIKGLPDQPTAKHELINGEILSVSLVSRAANKEEFVMTKSEDPMQALAAEFQAIATFMQKTSEAIAKGFAKQQAAIDQLSKGADGQVIKVAPSNLNPNVPAIERQLRKRVRAQERLDAYWERPDCFPDVTEAELYRVVQKAEDKLYELGHADERATLDSSNAFFERGGTSNFLQGSVNSIEDVLGIGHATRKITKSDEDAIEVENCLIL